MMPHGPYPKLASILLWLGLTLCALATWKGADRLVSTGFAQSGVIWAVLMLVPLSSWVLGVGAWRELVKVHTGSVISWVDAFRQTGLLLVGKYIPGGVFGFLARLYDARAPDRPQHLLAGVAEQMLGAMVPVLVGLNLYLAAMSDKLWLLIALPSIPFIASRLARLVPSLLKRWVPSVITDGGEQHTSAVLMNYSYAACLILLQQLLWATLAGVVAIELTGIDGSQALGVAGSFGLAVAAGMLALFFPGGIGVREGVLVVLVMPWVDTNAAITVAAILRLCSAGLDVVAGAVAATVAARRGLQKVAREPKE